MKISDLANSRNGHAVIEVPTNIPELPTVRVRRIKTKEMLAIGEQKESGLALIVATILDDDGQPSFRDIEAVRELDWPLGKALFDAANKVNGLETEKAAKN